MDNYVSRNAAGLRAPTMDPRGRPPSQRRGLVVHWNGTPIGQPQHNGCDDLVRGIQRYHMQEKGWSDCAYSFIICQHGTTYEVRGWAWSQFANGELTPPAGTGNKLLAPSDSAWYTVMVLIGEGQKPTDKAREALRNLIGEVRERGAGKEVRRHNEFRVKTCPGPDLSQDVARYHNKDINEEDDFMSELSPAEQRRLLTNTDKILTQFDPRNPSGLRDALARTGERLADLQKATSDDEVNVTTAFKQKLDDAVQELKTAIEEHDASTDEPVQPLSGQMSLDEQPAQTMSVEDAQPVQQEEVVDNYPSAQALRNETPAQS